MDQDTTEAYVQNGSGDRASAVLEHVSAGANRITVRAARPN
ncbi:hypothetical protein [Saccharopolyspora hattusasensis]